MNKYQIHELIGRIKGKTQKKVYLGKHAGNVYYRLDCGIENKEGVKEIFAFAETVSQKNIWQAITKSQYVDKRYLFFCIRRRGKFALTNWRELNQQHEQKTTI